MVDKAEYNKKLYRENREERLEYCRRYRATHREELKAYGKKWRADPTNKAKQKEYNRQAQIRRRANPGVRRVKERLYRKKAIEEGRAIQGWLIKMYGGVPCMDCDGGFDFIVMDFDHRPEEVKEFAIGTMGDYKMTPERLAKVEKEIAKCDLVCSNCHRLRTKERYE